MYLLLFKNAAEIYDKLKAVTFNVLLILYCTGNSFSVKQKDFKTGKL